MVESKKTPKEAVKWEEHIAKKKSSGKNSGNTEIQKPAKRKSVEPLEAKKAQGNGHAGSTRTNDTEGHAGHEHSHDGHAHAAKAEVKTPLAAAEKRAKDEKKPAAKEGKKPGKVKQKSRKVIVKRSETVVGQREKALAKASLPAFRGR